MINNKSNVLLIKKEIEKQFFLDCWVILLLQRYRYLTLTQVLRHFQKSRQITFTIEKPNVQFYGNTD